MSRGDGENKKYLLKERYRKYHAGWNKLSGPCMDLID